MVKKTDYIAVFDSGVGGISVLRQLVKIMPGERYLYFGDSANAPYGVRSTQQICQLTEAAVERMLERGVKALVIACNTATAAAIDRLRQKYPERIVIGIEPALKPAVTRFPQSSIGIMATPATLQGDKLKRLVARHPHPDIRLIPAPGLVELVESGNAESSLMDQFLQPILSPFVGELSALVLGCTHYPFAIPAIRRILPDTVLFDGGPGTARQTRRLLAQQELLEEGAGEILIENSLQDPGILELCKKLLTEDSYE